MHAYLMDLRETKSKKKFTRINIYWVARLVTNLRDGMERDLPVPPTNTGDESVPRVA